MVRTFEFEIAYGLRIKRANYTGGCHRNSAVLQRARARVGETCYNVITNFARAYPRWCKTGYGGLTHSDRAANDRYRQAVGGNLAHTAA